MTPVSTQRHDALREIGFELRSRAADSLERRRRQRLVAACGAAVAVIVLSVGITLPKGGADSSGVAVADVLNKAAASARQDLEVGPGQFLFRDALLYRHYYASRGEHYDYSTVASERHWIDDDGSALLVTGKAAGPTFDTQLEADRFAADGSPVDRIKLADGAKQQLPAGSLGGVYDDVGKSLSDYAGDSQLVRRVLDVYRLDTGKLVALSANQQQFNDLVRGHVRQVMSVLRQKPQSQIDAAAVDHATASLVIGLLVNWRDAMPPQLRPAFLGLLADTAGPGFEFDPDFTDEQGRRWIALGTEADGRNDASGGKAHETLLFDPNTFEQRGSRLFQPDGKIGYTEVLRYGVADREGETPAGLPSL